MVCDPTHVALDALLVYNPVDLVGGDARFQGSRRNIKDLSCQSADFAHGILGFGIQNFDLVPVDEASGLWNAGL